MKLRLLIICLLICNIVLASDLNSKYTKDLIKLTSEVFKIKDTLCVFNVDNNSEFTLFVSNGRKLVNTNTNEKYNLSELNNAYPLMYYKILRYKDFLFYRNLINKIYNVQISKIYSDSSYYTNPYREFIIKYDSIVDINLSYFITTETKTIVYNHKLNTGNPFYSDYTLIPKINENKYAKIPYNNIYDKSYGVYLLDSLKTIFNIDKYRKHYFNRLIEKRDNLNSELINAKDSLIFIKTDNEKIIKSLDNTFKNYKIAIDFDIIETYSKYNHIISIDYINLSKKPIKTIKVKFKGTNSIYEDVTYSKELSCIGFIDYLESASCEFEYVFGTKSPYYTSIHSIVLLYKDGTIEKINKNEYSSSIEFNKQLLLVGESKSNLNYIVNRCIEIEQELERINKEITDLKLKI